MVAGEIPFFKSNLKAKVAGKLTAKETKLDCNLVSNSITTEAWLQNGKKDNLLSDIVNAILHIRINIGRSNKVLHFRTRMPVSIGTHLPSVVNI